MKFAKYWGPTILYMTVIFFLSTRQRLKVSDVYAVQFLFFKSLHVVEYALLYSLCYRSLSNYHSFPKWEARYIAFLIAVLYGISDEIHQMFVPTREGTFRDVLIDTLGVTIAYIYLWKLLPRGPKILKNMARVLEIS